MRSIHVVGSMNVDYVLPVGRIAQVGETLLGGDLLRYPGGKGANQAVAASMLGASARMVGMRGDDEDGRYIEASLLRSGVDTSGIGMSSRPSGAAFIQVLPNGNNSIVVSPGANAALTPAAVRDQLSGLQRDDFVLCQLESPLDAVEEALRIARSVGATSILDPAPARRLPEACLRLVDFLTPNETEAALLLGSDFTDGGDAIQGLSRLGARRVVMKAGASGAWIQGPEGASRIPAFAVEAVDTTAAGDTFNAALAVGMIEARPLPDAVRFACAAAAISVTRHGAQTSCPSRTEAISLYRSVGRA